MPDLGSFVNDQATYKRTIFGLSTDVSKVTAACTTNSKLFQTGEVMYCVDNGDTYIYEQTTATWYKQ